MKRIIFILAVLFTISISAQSNYEVIIVPKKFSFLKSENKYNLNSLTKSFFETEGFKVYYAEDNLPKEIANNRCIALFADVNENNGLFMSRLTVVLTDCQNNVVYTSAEGLSREKDYHKAYNEALRIALVSLRGNLKIENKNTVEVAKLEEKKLQEISEKTELKEVQPIITAPVKKNEGILYALPIQNGYKVVDSTPTVVYLVHATTNESVYIASKGEVKGVFMKKMNGWFFEYYKNEILVSEKVEVKF